MAGTNGFTANAQKGYGRFRRRSDDFTAYSGTNPCRNFGFTENGGSYYYDDTYFMCLSVYTKIFYKRRYDRRGKRLKILHKKSLLLFA